jgi:hypothetical protein
MQNGRANILQLTTAELHQQPIYVGYRIMLIDYCTIFSFWKNFTVIPKSRSQPTKALADIDVGKQLEQHNTHCLELRRWTFSIFGKEVFIETYVSLTANLVTRLTVRNTFYHATLQQATQQHKSVSKGNKAVENNLKKLPESSYFHNKTNKRKPKPIKLQVAKNFKSFVGSLWILCWSWKVCIGQSCAVMLNNDSITILIFINN